MVNKHIRLLQQSLGAPIQTYRVLDTTPLKPSKRAKASSKAITVRILAVWAMMVWGFVVFWIAQEIARWHYGIH